MMGQSQPRQDDDAEYTLGATIEDRAVYRMRRRRILRLGYGREMTELLARSSANLHELEALAAAGCDLCTAAQIVL